MTADFRGKGALPTNHCWCQKTRVIAFSCGIKIFAVRCLVLSQYTHLTDRRTDRQNSDSNTVRCITSSRMVKTKQSLFRVVPHLGRLGWKKLWLPLGVLTPSHLDTPLLWTTYIIIFFTLGIYDPEGFWKKIK